MSQHKATLRVESLEQRETPAAFGTPWLDGMHITFSFAPDGTPISGQNSELSEVLASLGPSARTEILRAFQTWVARANINVGLVADGGQDFAAGGAFQGDSRFGDIRIGARELSSEVLAITAPFGYFDSFSGNIVLNRSAPLSIGGANNTYDLYTILMQETGHAFGIANSDDPNSVMYEYYREPRLGLSAGDIAAIQALYGARRADSFEGTSGNDALNRATAYSEPLEADLTTAADVDCFRFTTSLLTSSVRIRLNAAGLSLLTARVEVLNSSGQIIASAQASDPTNNDLTVHLSNVKTLSTYYVRVRAADGSTFNVGSYQLTVEQRNILGDLIGGVNNLLNETGLNDTLATATQLVQQVATLNGQVDFNTRGRLASNKDVDVYKVHAPQSPDGQPVTLIAAVWGLDANNLDPRVEVFDSNGNLLDAQILTNDHRTFAVQVRGVAGNADYYLRVKSDTQQTGNYDLAVDFRAAAVAFDLNATGTFTSSVTESRARLTVAQTSVFHFVLAGRAANWNGSLEMTILNSEGVVVFQLTTLAGDARSGKVQLASGNYEVRVRVVGTPPAGGVSFDLRGCFITDPIGVQAQDTSSTPGGGTDPGTGAGNPPPSGSQQTTWECTTPGDGSTWF